MAVFPSMTFNAKGNIINNQGIAFNSVLTTGNIDASNKFEIQFQVEVTFGGSLSTVNGLQVDAYRLFGAGPTVDTIAVTSFVIPGTISTTKDQSFALPTGKYLLKLTNLDGSFSVSSVYVTSSTIDSIG